MKSNSVDVDMVDVFEDMLCQRAMNGLRPVLYISSLTDLECTMVMLLDEGAEEFNVDQTKAARNRPRHIVTTN